MTTTHYYYNIVYYFSKHKISFSLRGKHHFFPYLPFPLYYIYFSFLVAALERLRFRRHYPPILVLYILISRYSMALVYCDFHGRVNLCTYLCFNFHFALYVFHPLRNLCVFLRIWFILLYSVHACYWRNGDIRSEVLIRFS